MGHRQIRPNLTNVKTLCGCLVHPFAPTFTSSVTTIAILPRQQLYYTYRGRYFVIVRVQLRMRKENKIAWKISQKKKKKKKKKNFGKNSKKKKKKKKKKK